MRRLENKLVLVTGAAQGIGLKMAERFAGQRAEVILTDLKTETLEQAVRSLKAKGAKAHGYPMDVSDERVVLQARDQIHRDLGRIAVLVNNAGVVFGGPFLDVPLEQHLLTLRVNCEGMVMVTHAFLQDLIEQPEAHLVNIASASGLIGLPYGSTYAASKWAAIGFSESLRLELDLSGHGHVKVTTVCPSYIGTGMFAGVKPPSTTRILDPDRVADHILGAVQHNRVFVLDPLLVRVTPFLKGVLPTAVFDRVSRWIGVSSSMQSWQGHR